MRNESKFDRSRFLVGQESCDCAVREHQPVALALSDHEFDLVDQELARLRGVIDLAAALEKIPGDLPGLFSQQRTAVVAEPCRHAFIPISLGTSIARLGSCCGPRRSEEHTSELQSPCNLVCRLL